MNKAANDATDEELAAQAQAGSRPAFEELASRYGLRLFYFLRHQARSDEDVEDLVQETFLKVFRNIGRYDPQRRFSTWLFTVAFRLSVSRHRSQRLKPLPLHPDVPEIPSFGPQQALIRKEESLTAGNIWQVAGTLKPSEYEVLWLRYAEEMPIKDIASAMKRSLVGVRVLLHRSRLKLGKKLRVPSSAAGLADTAAVGQRLSIL